MINGCDIFIFHLFKYVFCIKIWQCKEIEYVRNDLKNIPILECGANFGHEYCFLHCTLSAIVFHVYPTLPVPVISPEFPCVT